ENTREATNVAIQGNGFFMVKGNSGVSYSRAGNFTFDQSGDLVNPAGLKVQGYTAINAATGLPITTGAPTNISVPPGVLRAPQATQGFSTDSNLDSSAATGTVFTTSVQVYDSLGTPHVATITYTKQAAAVGSQWGYEVTVPATEATGAAGATAGTISLGTGT